MQTVRLRARTIGTLIGVLAAAGIPLAAPASSAGQSYNFTYGAGTHAHLWVASESVQEGGTCTIDTNYAVTQSNFLGNRTDSAAFAVSQLPVVNGALAVTWHAAVPATQNKLLLRFVAMPNCVTKAVYPNVSAGPATPVAVPAGSTYLIVSATEGTGQPQFTFG
ncbi:MAG TPA: hypothetical protein VFA94_17095 [Acidimicrobiales bacterium]|nr:hypothetical protein [Acidimicrobiales bacterium]